jgi:hypothetical protein
MYLPHQEHAYAIPPAAFALSSACPTVISLFDPPECIHAGFELISTPTEITSTGLEPMAHGPELMGAEEERIPTGAELTLWRINDFYGIKGAGTHFFRAEPVLTGVSSRLCKTFAVCACIGLLSDLR